MNDWIRKKLELTGKAHLLVYFLAPIFLLSLERILALEDRSDLFVLFGWYSLLGVCFIGIALSYKKISVAFLVLLAILGQLICLIHLPHLSTDYFRFLWDGELLTQGINPYDFTPNEYIIAHPNGSSYMRSLHEGMGALSAKNYSCYPIVNQLYFYLSTLCSHALFEGVVIMRILIIFTHVLGGWACIQILKILNKDIRRSAWLFLNPLVIIECTGNLHFEGVMLSMIFMGIYFLMRSKLYLSGVLLVCAVHIKLIPVILIGGLVKTMKSLKRLQYLGLIFSGVMLLFIAFLNLGNIGHFLGSLKLYYSTFEFNSALVLPLSEFIGWLALYFPENISRSLFGMEAKYWNPVPFLSPLFGFSILCLTALIYRRQKELDWNSFFEFSVILLLGYYLLTSTVHPWYIVVPLGLSIFCENRIPLVWSLSVFASYALYMKTDNSNLSLLVWVIQYVPILWMIFIQQKKKVPN